MYTHIKDFVCYGNVEVIKSPTAQLFVLQTALSETTKNTSQHQWILRTKGKWYGKFVKW